MLPCRETFLSRRYRLTIALSRTILDNMNEYSFMLWS